MSTYLIGDIVPLAGESQQNPRTSPFFAHVLGQVSPEPDHQLTFPKEAWEIKVLGLNGGVGPGIWIVPDRTLGP